jgi:hypothetical protein
MPRNDLKDFEMQSRLKFLVGLITFTVMLRLLPYVLKNYDYQIDPEVIYYPWNFSPLMAISLYAGATITDRRFRFGLPILTLLLSDLGIWAMTGQFSWAFPPGYWSSYLCNVIAVVMGSGLSRQTGSSRLFAAVGCGMIAETLFFVVTNFMYFWTQTLHPHTPAGLIACYIAGIPFAGKSFASTAVYSLLLFSPLVNRANAGSKETPLVLQPVRSL